MIIWYSYEFLYADFSLVLFLADIFFYTLLLEKQVPFLS